MRSTPLFRVAPSLFGIALLMVLWWRLIGHLSVEWSTNPQYGFGWAVPVLGAYLAWQNWTRRRRTFLQTRQHCRRLLLVAALPLGLAYFPFRLVQEANPDWRLVSWVLTFLVVGVTLLLLPALIQNAFSICGQSDRAGEPAGSLDRRNVYSIFAFPLLFFLVAVPWPSFIEGPVIQSLTEANAAVTLEVLTIFGVTAVRQGNLIQVATGVVGIDEACSGIRSFQATLMISLFLGELYRFSVLRRLFCVVLGFLLAFMFNVGRTTLLTWVASEQGTDAITRWHDPAGTAILVACFTSLWGVSAWLSKHTDGTRLHGPDSDVASNPMLPASLATPGRPPGDAAGSHALLASSADLLPGRNFCFATFGLGALVFASELGVHLWYSSLESRLPEPMPWSVRLPSSKPDFKPVPLSDTTRDLLKCDSFASAVWSENSTRWQAIFIQWNPGEVAGYLSKVHNPSVCLPSSGYQMVGYSDPKLYDVHGLRLPFSHYVFSRGGELAHVFYCLWDDRRRGEPFLRQGGGVWQNRLKAIWQGRGNSGQRVLELALWGVSEASAAEGELIALLPTLIGPAESPGGIDALTSNQTNNE